MAAKAEMNWLEQCGFGPKVMKRIKVCPHCGTVVDSEQSVLLIWKYRSQSS